MKTSRRLKATRKTRGEGVQNPLGEGEPNVSCDVTKRIKANGLSRARVQQLEFI